MSSCMPVKSDPFACAMFTHNGNVVAIDLFGAGIPLALSMLFTANLLARSVFRVWRYRLAIYAALTIGLGLAAAGEYIVWDSLYGGISVNTRLLMYTVLLPAGALGFLALDRAARPKLSVLQTYVVGTVGTALSDLFRTFSGTLNVSPQIIGAAGPVDGVFLDGLLLILGYMGCAATYVSVLRWKKSKRGAASNTAATTAIHS